MEFFGAKSQTSLPQKVQPYPPSVFSAGGGYGSDGSGGGGGGGGWRDGCIRRLHS